MPRVHCTGDPWPYDRLEVGTLAGGDAGTRETLAAMARMARDGARSREITDLAAALMDAGPRSPHLYAVRVFHYLRQRVSFKADPPGIELVRHPVQLVSEIGRFGRALGDCDDRSTLGASLLVAANIPAAFLVIGQDPHAAMEHVYFAARLAGRWVPFDPQETDAPGKQPAHARRWLYPV